MNDFYTYVWYRNDTSVPEPFYVGKGKGKRFKAYHNEHFDNIMNIHEILGIKPTVKFVYKGSEEMAYKTEIALIAKIGRRYTGTGPLINLTPGGEGGCPSGEKHWNYGNKASMETRKKQSESHKGLKHTKKEKIKISQSVSKSKSKITWLITFPDGTQKKIKNLSGFARKNNLHHGHLYRVASGKREHHKGFKCTSLGVLNEI